MREAKIGRMNLNLRTSVVSPNRHADGANCLDVSPLSHREIEELNLSPFKNSSNSTEDDLTRSGNN